LRYLSAANIQAMDLKTVPPQQTDADARVNACPTLRQSTAQSPAPAHGEKPDLELHVFQSACASCHA